MIKRRFYRQDHADRDNDDDSDSSSSSSDSEVEAEATEEEEEEEEESERDDNDDEQVLEENENEKSCSTSSGYESEDSSANEIDIDSPGLINEEDTETGDGQEIVIDSQLSGKHGAEILETRSNIMPEKELVPADVPDCILKSKSVFKCRMCPRIVCLTEETMRAHLKSKRHTRSEKLFKEGRLKTMLNSDGEIENQETAMEMNARIVALGQDIKKKEDKNKGRQRQRKRSRRQTVGDDSNKNKARESTKGSAKKRRKNDN